MKKILSLCLAILMILSVIPVMATTAYSVTGITDDECIYIHSGMTPVYTRTVGISSTDGVSKVTYAVDGEVQATKTEAPFSWDMPLADVNAHELVVTAYDASDAAVYTSDAISYTVAYTFNKTVVGSDFDVDDEVGTSVTTGNSVLGGVDVPEGSVTYENAPDRTGKTINVKAGTNRQPTIAFSGVGKAGIAKPANGLLRLDFDIYRTSGSSADRLVIANGNWYGSHEEVLLYMRNESPYNVPKNGWYTVSVLFDFNQGTNGSYQVLVGNNVVTDTTPLSKSYNNICLYLITQSSFYIDNLSIYNVVAEEKPMMFGSYSYKSDNDSLYVEGHVVNYSNEEDDCVLLFATYDASGQLVSAVSEPVSAASKSIAGANKTMAKENNGRTAVKAKVFCWNSLTDLQPIEKLGE